MMKRTLICLLGCGLAAVALQGNSAESAASSPAGSTATNPVSGSLTSPAQVADEPLTLTVSGEGKLSVRPEVATVQLGAEAQAKTATAAQATVSATVSNMVTALQKLGIAEKDIQTASLSLEPVYAQPQPGQESQPPQLVAFRASNTIQVNVFDLARVGEVIDAAFQAGANRLEGVAFGLVNESQYRKQALQVAAQDATAQAQALAETLGVALVGVRRARVDAVSVPAGGAASSSTTQTSAASTPVEPGQIEVRAAVTVVYDIQQSHQIE